MGSILKNPEKKNPILPHLNPMNLPINIRITGNSKNSLKFQDPPEPKSGRLGKILLSMKFKSNGRLRELNEIDGIFHPVKDIFPIFGSEIDNPGISIPRSQLMSGQENLNDPSEFHHPLLLPLKQMKEKSGKWRFNPSQERPSICEKSNPCGNRAKILVNLVFPHQIENH